MFRPRRNYFVPLYGLVLRGLKEQANSFKRACGTVAETAKFPLTEEQLQFLEADLQTYEKTQTEQSKKTVKLKSKLTIKSIKPERNAPLAEPVTFENQHQHLANVITPFCEMPYFKQIRLKEEQMKRVLNFLGKRLRDAKAPVEKTIMGLPCPLEPTRPSPNLLDYRNKDEFGIHFGVDGNPKTVGFFVGKPTDPKMVCVPPTYLINTRDSHKQIAKSFQKYIRQSPYDACHRFDTGGTWRNILVRSTQGGEKMGVVYIHPQNMPRDEIKEIMADLKRYYFEGEGSECELDSLYLQACKNTRCTREQAPYHLIHGKNYITETCLDLSFQISPDSFFQINTRGAEVLYSAVREIAEVSPITTLLDICCGTGSISLVMSPHVRGTVGIDMVTEAVEDARNNATLNNLANTQFFAGKAEKVLPKLAQDLKDCTEVVAIVNPARSGLHQNVIRTIRQCEAITKLIYISCKPEGYAMENFVKLGSLKGKGKYKENTAPFVPKYAVPVDMFPHTNHTELVLLFERVQS
ncbi:hypothetical protein Pcinc_008105 [Petrolisthes cinctipes]|uniref:tRNA (uracil(54)-C(5))-methyltransferase n=1 Tax=Petrolisthes cinctipes TaxID=88211 RepID=A0AAE1G9U3_PETCI|nr:hypothetical protein Pcinc_008105 [Petrolisthes cinctipes]